MSAPLVWVNGVLGGSVDPLDRGFTLGDGVFDTLTAFNRIPFAGDRHLQRLIGQAAAIGVAVNPDRVRAGWAAVLSAAEADHIVLRTTVTRGVAGRGLWPPDPPVLTVAVSATPWNPNLAGREVRLSVSSIRRNPASPSSRMKTLGYLDHVLAAREAAEKNADDALFLGPEGKAVCTTIANLFVVVGAKLLTPPEADGVMPGVIRALLLEAAGSSGLAAEERSLLPLDLVSADAVFVTNSVRFLSPVVSVDGVALARRAPAVETTLRELFANRARDTCGFDLFQGS